MCLLEADGYGWLQGVQCLGNKQVALWRSWMLVPDGGATDIEHLTVTNTQTYRVAWPSSRSREGLCGGWGGISLQLLPLTGKSSGVRRPQRYRRSPHLQHLPYYNSASLQLWSENMQSSTNRRTILTCLAYFSTLLAAGEPRNVRFTDRMPRLKVSLPQPDSLSEFSSDDLTVMGKESGNGLGQMCHCQSRPFAIQPISSTQVLIL